jgi:hypothetical protein
MDAARPPGVHTSHPPRFPTYSYPTSRLPCRPCSPDFLMLRALYPAATSGQNSMICSPGCRTSLPRPRPAGRPRPAPVTPLTIATVFFEACPAAASALEGLAAAARPLSCPRCPRGRPRALPLPLPLPLAGAGCAVSSGSSSPLRS